MAPLAPAGTLPALTVWSPRGARLAAYLHLPFCAERCGYCSFNTAPYSAGALDRFLTALLSEIELLSAAPWRGTVTLGSLFFGGGTPSLASPEQLAAVLDALRARFTLEPGAEITVECNPDDVTVARFAGYRRAGVTRISLGVQSLDDGVLRTLDRRHSAAQARGAFDAARRAGFDNVSCDLIYGLPGLDLATWEATAREVITWGPEHLSAYGLTLDEGSLWHSAGVSGLPTEEAVTAQYWALARLAAEAGYEHYEISNYARPGRRSTHNQVYWRGEEYVALGPGACGFLGDVRYGNVKPVERYCVLLEGGELPVGFHEVLTPRQRLAERLMLGLRMREGVPAAWLAERVALDPGRLPALLGEWKKRDLLKEGAGRVCLTEAGFLLSDALFIELL
ncbi:MAG TPA: radical SAM family heme chaperone HemW [Methylomirabilota bacterium]|nr:radical SAM family heme chaperone HemW [Methylomirabilota bacterium]